MKYISTRGKESGLTFEKVLLSGYAEDGGIYFPESIPKLSKEELTAWSKLSYPELLKRIFAVFVTEDEIPASDVSKLVDNAFARFKVPEVVRIAKLNDGLNVAELFHGPTMAFKDLALSMAGQLYNYFLGKRKEHRTILVGTSGDTGSAAINAVRGMEWVDIVVLLPKGRCTEIQELQMTTVIEDNVFNFAVDGSSDELDVPIKKVFSDWSYVQKHNLCSINSINWGRILPQIAHFVYSYFQVCEEVGQDVQIIVPTGACGNITSAFVARSLGIPLHLICAVNSNDIVHRTFSTGDFSVLDNFTQTWSTAMDISSPYNMERIILMTCGFDTGRVKSIMDEYEATGKVKIPDDILNNIKNVVRDSISVPDEEIISTMKRCWSENSYLLCPHTAVGVRYHYKKPVSCPKVCIATASPAKFPEAVREAQLDPEDPEEIQRLFGMETKFEWMRRDQDWEKILKDKIEEITDKVQKRPIQ